MGSEPVQESAENKIFVSCRSCGGMANVRIISSFTKSEREKIGVIQDIYKICIGTELPRELQLEKHKPVHKYVPFPELDPILLISFS